MSPNRSIGLVQAASIPSDSGFSLIIEHISQEWAEGARQIMEAFP
jgi:hypothetical protein